MRPMEQNLVEVVLELSDDGKAVSSPELQPPWVFDVLLFTPQLLLHWLFPPGSLPGLLWARSLILYAHNLNQLF